MLPLPPFLLNNWSWMNSLKKEKKQDKNEDELSFLNKTGITAVMLMVIILVAIKIAELLKLL